MWRLRIAGISHLADLLAPTHSLAGAHRDAAASHMRVQRVDVVSEIDDREISIGFIERQPLGEPSRWLIAKIVAGRDRRTVRDSKDRLIVMR